MRVIYTSKGMSKSLGCALYIGKYGTFLVGKDIETIEISERFLIIE